jgi:integrase
MALVKRGKTWHTQFWVDGQRFRQSLHTGDWRKAQSAESKLIAQAEQGKLSATSQQFARLPFSEALDRYLADRAARVGARSQRSEADHAKPLRLHFRQNRVRQITAEGILAYIRQRKAGGLSNTTVNMEIGILRRVLKRAKHWHLVADDIRPLPERRDIGRALGQDDKLRLLKVAASRPEWETARWAAVIVLNTTMRGCEVRELRWRDIDLMGRTLTVRRSKTLAGERVIPLNQDALRAVLVLRDRSKRLFGESLAPDWYVLPHAEGYSKPDPTKPMSGWRSAWRNLTRAVQCPKCGLLQAPTAKCREAECRTDMKDVRSSLHGLRFHDLRHHAITELAESQTSDQTTMSIAGHVSARMLAHYSHVRLEAKRKALDGLSGSSPKAATGGGLGGSYDTNDDTIPASGDLPAPEVIERNGGDDGTRTRDLCRDRAAF